MKTRALLLFSGGLDSILSAKVLERQGIEVICIRFVTPFFGQEALSDPEGEKERIRRKYGLRLEIHDISSEYIEMLKAPSHGYGKYLNPCLDCKILMVRKAVGLLPLYGAKFVATGEVLGQRPMSQRRDAMRIVERDSGAEGILLRPLSAKRLRPTKVEEEGLVNREGLLSITGRGRREQMELAHRFGIEDYPTPAGGCVLADPILSKRFREILRRYPSPDANDFLLAQVGRHFFLLDGSWLVIGRNQGENERLRGLARGGDMEITAPDVPSPTAIWRTARDMALKEEVEERFRRYVKKGQGEFKVEFKKLASQDHT